MSSFKIIYKAQLAMQNGKNKLYHLPNTRSSNNSSKNRSPQKEPQARPPSRPGSSSNIKPSVALSNQLVPVEEMSSNLARAPPKSFGGLAMERSLYQGFQSYTSLFHRPRDKGRLDLYSQTSTSQKNK